MRLLGLDIGEKRIGLALGDTETRLASPLEVWNNDQNFVSALSCLVLSENIEAIVFGLPRPLADQTRTTTQAQKIYAFIDQLKNSISIPFYEQNETWSSKAAQHYQHELGQKHKRDDLAAMLILQSWLDSYGLSA